MQEKAIETGRWSREEHQLFMQGKHSDYGRTDALWQKLEKNRKAHFDSNRGSGSFPCPEILQQITKT